MSTVLAPDAYADAEARLGRPLTLAERSIDIVGLDRDLAVGKARLHQAIEQEKQRAIRAHFTRGVSVRLKVTNDMVDALRALYVVGQRHAQNEIRELAGVAVGTGVHEDALAALVAKLRGLLISLEQSVNDRVAKITARQIALHGEQPRERTFAAELTIGGIAQAAATRQAMEIPGALNVASQLVSSAAFEGLGDVYDANSGLFTAWTYTAVMDNATCDECEAHDGEEFESWDAIQEVLPDGGPNPECYGEGRCRCRAVPAELSELGATVGEPGILPSVSGEEVELTPPQGFTVMSLPATGRDIYRTEEAHAAYKGKTSWGQGHYFGTNKHEVAEMTLDPNSEVVEVADLSKVNTHRLPGNARILEINADEMTNAELQANSGEALREKTLAAGFDGVHVISESLNMGGDQIVLYRSLDEIASRETGLLGSPPPEFKGLPKHAQQPVATLTRDEALQQIKRLEGNIRGLHWHAKQGKPLNTDKLAVYERRIDELRAHIEGGAAPARVIEPAVSTSAGELQPAIAGSAGKTEAKKLASKATSLLEKRQVSAAQAKQEIQKALADRLRGNQAFTESVRRPTAAPQSQAKKVSELQVGDEVELPAYPGYQYRVTGDTYTSGKGELRRQMKIIKAPVGHPPEGSPGNSVFIHADRTALPLQKVPTSAGKVFKHNWPLDKYAAADDFEQAVSASVSRWAGTSADNDAWALAMQQAIKDEFDLAEESLRHFQAAGNWGQAQEIYAEHGEALRAFARAMYDNTQAQLRAEGVDEVVLYRGQGFMPGEHIPGVHPAADVRLQPASSFSSSYSTASGFQRGYGENIAGGGIIIARVPAERILGSARTGFGCLSENEYVLLGKGVGRTDLMNVEMAQEGSVVYKQVDTFLADIEIEVRGRLPAGAGEIPRDGIQALIDGLEYEPETLDKFAGLADQLHLSTALEDYEINGLFDALEVIPEDVLKKMAPDGIYVGHGGVSSLDDLQFAKGTQWDTTAGAYYKGKVVISADLANAYGTSSANVYLHELGHAFQEKYGYTNSPVLAQQHARLVEAGKLSPYLTGNTPEMGAKELFAEAFANATGSGSFGHQQLVSKFDKQFADWFMQILRDEGVVG